MRDNKRSKGENGYFKNKRRLVKSPKFKEKQKRNTKFQKNIVT